MEDSPIALQHHLSRETYSTAFSPGQETISRLVSTSFKSSKYFYFHHIINPVEATLKIEVIGPNLTHTFTHTRAKASGSPSKTFFTLENKTVGFITLTQPDKSIILGWAESGHGLGRLGDLLDAPRGSPVLSNKIWTRRVVKMGEDVLSLNMARVFDTMGKFGVRDRESLRGVFLGSHVEVKLAVFGVCLLLKTFGITNNMDNVTRRQLMALRHPSIVWQDGTRPELEVYFSRKNCHPCGKFVRELQRLTGIKISLCWKDRLAKKVYNGSAVTKMLESPRQAVTVPDAFAIDDTKLVVMDEDENSGIEIIDQVDLADTILKEEEGELSTADAYADGLAYCVGQIDQEPRTARAAILDLAERLHRHRENTEERINKPLPATPVTELPAMLDFRLGPRLEFGRQARSPAATRRNRTK